MLIIKGYLELNEIERNEVYKFVNRNCDTKKSLKEREEIFNKRINGYGEGSLFCFIDKKVVGKILVVLEVVKKLGTIYIYSMDVLENIEDKKQVVVNLINGALTVPKRYNPSSIFLSASNIELLKIFEELGYKHEYYSLTMHLEDKIVRGKTLDLLTLSNENKEKYLEVINKSFSDMPHGTYHYISDIEEYIKMANENNYFFMVAKDNDIVGFMNIEIEKDRGLFDIGLCKECRGKGYGKKILETAIDFLNKKSVENIELIVIKKNYRAYNMYKNRGFEEKSILGYWMEVK